jgi:hypothetical protein
LNDTHIQRGNKLTDSEAANMLSGVTSDNPTGELYNALSAATLGGAGLTSLAAQMLLPTGLLDQESVIDEVPAYRPSLDEIPWTWEWSMNEVGADPSAAESMLGAMFDPGIAGELSAAAALTGKVGRTIRGGVPVEDALIVQHNMSADNLRHADKMGGMPMPSIGIAKASQPIEGYGDITLLADKGLARPAARNPVFSADAYTSTYPSINYTLSDVDANKLQDFVLEPFNISRTDYTATRELPVSIYGLVDDLENNGIRSWENNPSLQARFLWERGELDDLPKIRKGQQPENYYDRRESINDELMAARDADDIDGWQEAKSRLDALDQEARLAQDPLKNILYEKVGKPSSELRGEFEQWVSNIPERLGLDVKERIWAGYTPSGNAKFKPHTLENVVSMMRKDMRENQTGMFGSGALRAQVAPQFRTITEIQGARGRIRPSEEIDALKDGLNEKLIDISDSIGKYAKYRDDNPFIQADRVRDQLVEISTGQAKWEDYFRGVPDELKSSWGDYINELRDAPTAYFEAKPMRAVSLDEFSDAMIPSDAGDDIANILARHGINVERYTDEADRAKRMMGKESLLFQHPAATLLGGSLAAALLAEMGGDEPLFNY